MVDKLIYQGVWFLPENEENQVVGTLTFEANSGANLELIGTLVDDVEYNDFHEPNFILGLTSNGKVITLYKSNEYQRVLSSPGMEISKYFSRYILIGDHFTNEDDLIFDSIKGRFKNLDGWISKFGFTQIDFDHKNKKVGINYELPSPVDFQVNDEIKGKLNFRFTAPLGKAIHKAIVEQKSEIIFETATAKSFLELLEILRLFQNFLTLGTFEPAYPFSLSVINKSKRDEDDSEAKEITIIYRPSFNFTEADKRNLREYLFAFPDISDNFQTIIQKWFSQRDKIEPITDLLFDSFYHQGKFTENRFLNIVQALETFHRRFRKNESRTREDHKTMIDEIIKSVPEDHKKWLQERLNFSNEPTLHNRLDELIMEVSNNTIDKIIKDKEQFVKDTKNSRNYYTHYDVNTQKKALKGSQLFFLTEKLRTLLIALILFETGFTEEQVDSLFKRNEFRFFNHILDK